MRDENDITDFEKIRLSQINSIWWLFFRVFREIHFRLISKIGVKVFLIHDSQPNNVCTIHSEYLSIYYYSNNYTFYILINFTKRKSIH